jgi:hypothetical protein
MIQFILTWFIVSAAATLTVIRTIRFFSNPKHACEGCDLGAKDCRLAEFKSRSKIQNQATH